MAISQNFTDSEGFLWDLRSVAPNTGSGLAVLDGTNDAFDDAFQLIVNSNAVNPQVASVDFGGRELNTAPFLSGDIAVTRSVMVSDVSVSNVGFARFLDSFTNTGTTTQVVTVVLTVNLGSDAGTLIQSTTSGDLVFSAADFGFASDDANLSGADPAVGMAYGDGSGLLPGAVSTQVGFPTMSYTLTLAPGETQRLLYFAVQNTAAGASVTDYQLFTRNLDTMRAENLLAGLSETEISQVVNYTYDGGALRPVVLTDGDGNRWGVDQNTFGLRSLDTDALLDANPGDVVLLNFTANPTVTLAEYGQEATYRATLASFPNTSASYSVMASPAEGYVRALLQLDPGDITLTLTSGVTGLDARFAGTQALIEDRPLAGGAGDGTVTLADGGVLIDDSASGAGGTRPALTVVFGDTAAVDANATDEANTLTANRLTVTDAITLTSATSFLYFFALNDDGLGGMADLAALSQPGYKALAGLSKAEVASIVNFDLDETDRLQTTMFGSGDDEIDGGYWGDQVFAGAGNDTVRGGGSDDILRGEDGNDDLRGGEGWDTLIGGPGNDVYFDPGGDVIVEAANEGTDTIFSSTSRTLDANFENLTLIGAATQGTGNELANRIVGNDAANILEGGAGNDTLNGGKGADTMRGGAGNDYYTVERSGDQTIEDIAGPAGGIDTVYASVNRTLGANIENLVLQGTAGLRGIGNELANKMTGNSGANLLQGLAGADRLDGGGGNDTLEGGAQNDTLTGGAGADRFRFAASDAGVDRILDFDQSADRFELTGLFTALSIAPNGDAVLTHAGGTVRVAAPPSLSLAQWNALVLPLGAKAVSAAAMADDTAVHAPAAHASDLALAPHGDWTFA